MQPRLANLATVISLALCLASMAGWARSFWIADAPHLQVRRGSGANVIDRHVVFESARGRLVLSFGETRLTHDPAKVKFDFPDHVGFAWEGGASLRRASFVDQFRIVRLGNGWRPVPGGRARRIGIALPYALPIVGFALLPLQWWRRWRDRQPPGHCARCGYDLRATPSCCPECGAVVEVPPPPPTQNPPPEQTAAVV